MHKNIAKNLFFMEVNGLLGVIDHWTYDASGEKRSGATGSLLKDKGLKSGTPDYLLRVVINGLHHFCYIEVKTEFGKLQPNQKEFAKKCSDIKNTHWYLARSVNEFLHIVEHIKVGKFDLPDYQEIERKSVLKR